MAIWQFDLSFVPRTGAVNRRREGCYGASSLPRGLATRGHAWLCLRLGARWRLREGWLVLGKELGCWVEPMPQALEAAIGISQALAFLSEPGPFLERLFLHRWMYGRCQPVKPG